MKNLEEVSGVCGEIASHDTNPTKQENRTDTRPRSPCGRGLFCEAGIVSDHGTHAPNQLISGTAIPSPEEPSPPSRKPPDTHSRNAWACNRGY
jgi:hypothetical protein